MSTTVRRCWLKFLRQIGVKHFRAKSSLGAPYLCHVGDLAGEAPFYSPQHSAAEIRVMTAWCKGIESPTIFDIGANNGFVATQLAQLLRDRSPKIYAFEPIPSTFAQLKSSISSLGLEEAVFPIWSAVSDSSGMVRLSFNPRESLFAQVRDDNSNPRAGGESVLAPAVTIDEAIESLTARPHLIKVDVEGFEPRVLKGAAQLLKSNDPPAICFEWNPLTVAEVSGSPRALLEGLSKYRLYYIDDFEGQKMPLGQSIPALGGLTWVCNVFAVPKHRERWSEGMPDALTAAE